MQLISGGTNSLPVGLARIADGLDLTSGTVYYQVRKHKPGDGEDGYWWHATGTTWAAAEGAAGTRPMGTYKNGNTWHYILPSAASGIAGWDLEYSAQDSGSLAYRDGPYRYTMQAGQILSATMVAGTVGDKAGYSITSGTLTDKTGFGITSGTLTDKAGFSLAADQSTVTVGTVRAVGSNFDKSAYSLAADQSAVTVGTTKAVGSVFDKTGYSVTSGTLTDKTGFGISSGTLTDKANFSLAANQSGVTIGTANAVGSNFDKTGYSLGSKIGIKKNTALSNFTFVMNGTDGNLASSLTVGAARSIDGGAFANCANAVSEIANGAYKINLAAGDLNGDVVAFKGSAANANTTMLTIITEP